MAAIVIVGAQWGDEGKGKVVDLYSEFADLIVRYGGGANAGHTLVIEGRRLVLHLIPSGAARGGGKRCLLADGMVIDPKALLEEIAQLQAGGLLADERSLLIGENAHVILPLHMLIDRLREQGKGAIGTTMRGIGPAYEFKAARRGVRMRDLLSPRRLRPLLEQSREEIGPYLAARGATLPHLDAELEEFLDYGRRLARYLGDVPQLIHQELARGRHVLFEGAQGALLDLDHGTYPFVTSSSTLAGGACTSAGIGPSSIDAVVGVAKAYATRVGAGPFPTELLDDEGALLRESGGEYGATTGRPRRCGWLDVAALRRAVRLSGIGALALTKLDVLRALRRVRLCVGYRWHGRLLDELPPSAEDLAEASPVYEEFSGWEEDLHEMREIEELPAETRRYVKRIEDLVGVPVSMISVGPGRGETLSFAHPFYHLGGRRLPATG